MAAVFVESKTTTWRPCENVFSFLFGGDNIEIGKVIQTKFVTNIAHTHTCIVHVHKMLFVVE